MAVQAQLADGRILEFPDGTDPSVVQATVKRMLSSSVGMDVSQMSTEELENAPSAPTTLGDIGRTLGAGVVGGAKTVADVFGAGNDVSNYLGKKAQEIQANITPERKAEMARRQELEKRASESGDLWQEAKAYLGGIAEAPIQSVAQAVGTSAPTLVAGLASVFAAPESALGIGVARMGQIALGAAQGVGEYKGDVHDSVKQAYMDEGYDASEAEKLAVRAQQYSMDKAMEIGGAGLLGALDAFTGVESSVRKAVEKAGKGKLTKEAIEAGIKELPEEAVTAPSLGMAALKSAAGEAPLEGLQGGFGQYAQNLALQREGLQEGDETQGVLGAALRDAAVGALTGGAFTPVKLSEMRSDYNLDQTLRQAKQDQEFEQERQAAIERSAGLPPQPEVYELPEGYRVTAQDVGVTEEPAEHHIMEEGSDVPLTTVPTLEEVQPKIDRLTEIRKAEAQKTLDQIDKINEGIKKQTEQLETLEATGQANTPQYEALKQQTQMAQDTASQQVAELMDKNETLTKNLVHVPGAPQQKVQQQFVLSKDGQNLGAFNSLQEAEHTVKRFVSPEAFKEFEETKEPVKPTIEPDQIETLKSTLEPLMAKFGLKDVGLNIVDNLKHGAEGSYTNKLVSVALDNPNPIQVLRHESIHALKDLGFFTPQQWSVLENMAKKKWIAEHLEGNRTEIDGENMTRLEGYKKMGLNDQQIAEEAIADAFAHFDKTKPPPGMLAALHNKLIKFFEALKNGFTGAGFQTAEHVFGKIERGELKGAENERPTGAVAGPGPTGGERKFSLGEGDRGTRAEARSIAPLEGAPTVQGAAGPDANLVSVAEKYAKDNGIKLNRQAKYAQVNEVFGKRLAQAYEEMPHAPNDPKVKEAYEDLIHQTRKQYDALVDAGYKFNFFDSETDPYQGNPWNAMRDLRKNKTMSVYGTYDGFGTEGVTDADVKDNPLLQNTGLKWKDQKGVEHDVTGNDLFRAVHDAFGHGIEGGGFRHHGEENAWQAHSRLYTGPALAALTSETRGQNSWLNFGPYGEKNKNAKVEETVFAPQKTGLMPEWAWKENTVLSEPDFIREPNIKGVTLGKKQPNASTFIGVHHGNAKVDVLSGKKYGTGIRGAERRRLDDAFDDRIKNRVYFYIPKENGEMPSPEAGLGGHVYKQKFDNILAPGSEMSKLFSKAQGDSNNFESEVIDAGYDGYAVPSMGMMVILNHDAPVHHLGTRAELAEQGIKYSLKKSEKEYKSNALNILDGVTPKPDLGKKVTVDAIGKYFDGLYPEPLDFNNPEHFAEAVIKAKEEIKHQLAKENSGLDWYDEDISRAFKTTAKVLPELKKPNKRVLFTIIAGIMSPETTARDNWVIAARAFKHYIDTGVIPGNNPATGGLWQGGLTSANKRTQLNLLNNMVKDLGEKGALNWLTMDHTVREINDFRSKYGNVKSGIGGKLNDMVPALYVFGPKVGPFVSNLNGIYDVTVDKWMIRTFNRYFGTMMGPDGKILNAPTEPQRRAVKTLINEVSQDANIKPYQAQSLLWFFEQSLFRELGTATPSYAFSDGATRFLEQYTQGGAGGREEGARGVAPSTGAEKLSLKRVSFPTAREARAAAKEAGIPDDAGFHKFIRATQFVDKDGKPKVMYHGTAGDIFEFIPAGQSNAIFVTDSAEEAEGFASEAEDRLRRKIYQALDKNEKVELFKRVADQAAADGEITQALANGIVSRVKKKVPEYGDFFGDIEQRMYDELIGLSPARASVMPVWVSGVNIFDYENPYHVEGVMERLKDNVKFEQRAKESEFTEDSPRAYPDHWLAGTKGRIVRGVWQAIEDKRVQQAIRDSGFDGFSVKEINGGRKNFAVYKPNQIKSVTGNVGEYSTNNKDIRYSLRAAPDTPEFKQWFKQSAVIDEDGKPMVMYHGTKADISKFKLDKKAHRSGNPDGYYFTPSTTDASRYAGENGNVMPVYLSIQNPFVQGSKVDYRMIGQYEKELRKDNPNLENDWIESKVNSFKQLAARGNNWFPGIFPNISFPTEAMTRVLEAGGYDGFKDGNHFIAIRPEQIKSATGNAGTYDVNNPDIRYSIPSISTAAEDRVNKVTTVREEQGFLSRMFSVLQPENYSSYRQAFLNRYNQLSEADKAAAQRMGGINLMAQDSAEHAALMSDMHAGVTASAFGVGGRKGGVPVIRNGLTTIDNSKKGLLEILMPLGKYNDPKVYQYFQFYSAVKRGVRLYSEGRERLIEPGDLVFAKELGQKFPEFEQIRKDWVEYNNNLIAYQKAAGVLSDRDAIEYTKHYDYIPFFRQLDGEKTMGPSIYQSISGVKKPKALKGGEAPLADFLETVVRNSQSAIAAGMKNIAAQRARDVGKQANIVHDITPGSKVSDFEKIKVLENGILKEYQSSDRLFIDAVKSLHMPEIPFMGLLSSPSNFLREAVTRDPGFILANLMRDSLSAYATSGQNMTPVIDTVKNFGKAFARKSPGFEAMMNYGIIGGYEFSENVEQSGRTVAKEISKRAGNKAPIGLRTFKSLWDGLEHATTASDAATRIAIYDRVMQETGNEAEAIRAAWEIMNFNRKGNSPLVRVLTAAVPFLNARVQGLDLFYRSATGKMNTQDAKLIQKRFIARASMMMALSVMYTLAVSGDPDYENQEDETKDNYWILPSLGLKIPIPFEVGTLFKTIPERIVRATFGNDTGQDLKDALWRATLTTLPINPVGYVPQVFKPMVEVMTNYNMFTGREIIGQGMKDIAPEYQVGPGTSNFSVFVGKTLGLSPMKVDHLIKGYSGTMGMYAIDLMDSIMDMNSDSPKPNKRFEQMPVIKRFALDPEARGSVTAYYKLKNDVDTAVRTSNLLEKSMEPDEFAKYMQENMGVLAFKDYVGDLEKSMKQFRDMRKMVTSSPMPGKEKQEALTAIGKGEQNLTANIQTVKKIIADI